MNQPRQTPDFSHFAAPQAKPRLVARNGVRVLPQADAALVAMATDMPTDTRDKGPKASDQYEVWHHHVSLRRPGEMDLMLRLDRRR